MSLEALGFFFVLSSVIVVPLAACIILAVMMVCRRKRKRSLKEEYEAFKIQVDRMVDVAITSDKYVECYTIYKALGLLQDKVYYEETNDKLRYVLTMRLQVAKKISKTFNIRVHPSL